MSHPSWVRGLKHNSHKGQTKGQIVAPLVGAWIETDKVSVQFALFQSHPSWVRGLKQITTLRLLTLNKVAPLVGAWIETLHIQINAVKKRRTPRGCVD